MYCKEVLIIPLDEGVTFEIYNHLEDEGYTDRLEKKLKETLIYHKTELYKGVTFPSYWTKEGDFKVTSIDFQPCIAEEATEIKIDKEGIRKFCKERIEKVASLRRDIENVLSGGGCSILEKTEEESVCLCSGKLWELTSTKKGIELRQRDKYEKRVE